MHIFDVHIIKRFSATLLALMVMLTFIFLLLDFLEHIDDFISNRAPTKDIVAFYLNYIPDILHLISPAAVFLSCVYLTGRLAQELQITALYTSGISLYRLMLPYFVVATIMTAMVFGLSGWIVPQTNIKKIELTKKYINQTQSDTIDEPNNLYRELSPNTIMGVGYYNKDTQSAINVSLQQFDQSKRLKKRLDAEQMNWQPKAKKWRLINVTMRWFDAQGNVQIQKQPTMDSLRILPAHLARSTNDVALLTLPQASVYMDELQRSGSNNIGQPMTLYYSKFTYPFANLVVIFLGIALAATRRKGGQSVQIAIGLIVAFVYLALIKIIEPFGYSGELDPLLTAILPHAFFLVLGLIMLWRTRK